MDSTARELDFAELEELSVVGGNDGGGDIQPTSLSSVLATLTVSIVIVTSTSIAWNTPNWDCTLEFC